MWTELQDRERMIRLSHFTIERATTSIFWVDYTSSVVRVNEAACKNLGYTREELVGMTVPEFDTDIPPGKWSNFWANLKRQRSLVFDSHQRRKDGSVFPIDSTVHIIEFEGTEYCCAFTRDITKRIEAEETLRNALKEVETLKRRLEEENQYLQEEIRDEHNFEEIVTRSNTLKKLLRKVEQVAPTDATVLILGETGSGKELLARALHNLSARRDRPLVKVNCSALPSNLIESELFGHEKGAFTGATARKVGRFELGDGGTIFLDEIGDLPLELQPKLLRVLQEGEFERLGDSRTINVDVRVLAATNKDLEKAIEDGEFREDLYYRLNVFPIKAPPLRDHKEDIPLLAKHFLDKYSQRMGKTIELIPLDVVAALQEYHWPGNVRELQNLIERAVIISSGRELELGEWFQRNTTAPGSTENSTLGDVERLQKKIEKDHILAVLESTGWRVSGPKGAATILGLKPTTLEARMKRLGIKRKGG